ncbi:STAP1 protein, partial [Corythaeola cristata]|nr:STAP1 protein [Corythaeola cristata]
RDQPEEIPQPTPRRIFQERQRITGLPLYFQGYLSVRHSKCQVRCAVRGIGCVELFLQYSQKLDISALTSATNVYPDENGSAQFILMLLDGELELKANDCECGKEWKGFILTVTKMSVPPDESLLPEQLTRMHEVLEKEKKRRIMLKNCSSTSMHRRSSPSSTLTTMPACFHAVSRQEATEMLEKNPSCGNLILRPGSDGKNYAVTIRHKLDMFYLVGFFVVVVLVKQVTLPSLQDVVNYFVTQTQGELKPFVIQTC